MLAAHTLIYRGAQIFHYAMGSVKPFMSQEIFNMVYCVYFHSIMNYGIIFSENSPYSVKVFKIHKNIIGIISGCRSSD
jgi:hypothetical protein